MKKIAERWPGGNVRALSEQAWERFVGSQPPGEFMAQAHPGTIKDVVSAYVKDLPIMFSDYEPMAVVTDWGATYTVEELLESYLHWQLGEKEKEK